MITLTLPYPPSANTYWRYVKGKVLRSREAKRYCEYVALHCNIHGIEPMDGELSVRATLYRPQRSGDLDNFLKITLDSLSGCAYHDDNQVVYIEAFRMDDPDDPRVEITIERLVQDAKQQT